MSGQIDMNGESGAPTTDSLLAALAALEDSGAACFDPARFRYIQAMTLRSQQQDTAVAKLLLAKARDALQSYQSRFAEQREAAAALLKQTATQHPGIAEELQRLFTAGEFKALRRLAQRQVRPAEKDTFVALTQQLKAAVSDSNNIPARGAQELKAVRHFRKNLQRQHAEKLVTHAIMDAPESAGPLNPQKLALSSLAIMRDVSPAYLSHFVSYVDTLFWLEKIDSLPPSK